MFIGKKSLWAGRVFSALAALPFIFSFAMKLIRSPMMLQGFNHLGWSEQVAIPLGILEACCVLLYLLPQVSVLGAVILTGYLGGAIATHVRIGEPVYVHVVIGLFIWLGLFLREPRLQELLPVRAKDFSYGKEILIQRPSDAVFAYLRLLGNFQHWNPFLKPDPNARLNYEGEDGNPGFVATWEGNSKVGSGEQEITKVVDGRRIEFELRFKKPFAATNRAFFEAEAMGSGQTRVRWMMSGKSPFPMSVIGMFINCEKMIGAQFESGLRELKSILEK